MTGTRERGKQRAFLQLQSKTKAIPKETYRKYTQDKDTRPVANTGYFSARPGDLSKFENYFTHNWQLGFLFDEVYALERLRRTRAKCLSTGLREFEISQDDSKTDTENY